MIKRFTSGNWRLTALSGVLCLCLTPPAFAQQIVLSPLSTAKLQPGAPLVLKPLTMSLARMKTGADGMEATPFILRLAGEYGTIGCMKPNKIPFTMSVVETTLKIIPGDYTTPRTKPVADKGKCVVGTTYPSADVPLTIAMLNEKKIQHIQLGTDDSAQYFDVHANKHFVELVPSTTYESSTNRFRPMQLATGKNPLKLWFYPSGTVILNSGSTSDDDTDLSDSIQSMAKAQGLTPLENVYSEFTQPLEEQQSYYYVDKTAKLTKQPGIEDGIAIGAVNVPVTVYGADGDETISRSVTVFARAPGAYE